jgi:hypothetical protein
MARLTFERILLIYMAVAALLALLTPTGFAVEYYAPINPSYVPFAGWLRRTPNALPYLTTYFFSLSILLPLVVALLARHPQEAALPLYEVPTLGRCLAATFCLAAIVAGFIYLHTITLDGTGTSRGAKFFYLISVSRLGLTIFGPLLMCFTALIAYLGLVKLPQIWHGFLFERPA